MSDMPNIRDVPVIDDISILTDMDDIQEEEDIKDLREFAEKVAELHKWCANHPNPTISFYRDMPYHTTRELLKDAIKEGWPNLNTNDIEAIYDIWVDSGENVAYAVNTRIQFIRREDGEVDIYGNDLFPTRWDKCPETDYQDNLSEAGTSQAYRDWIGKED